MRENCGKHPYKSREQAHVAMRSASARAPKWRKEGPPVEVYKCPFCEDAWHFGHRAKRFA